VIPVADHDHDPADQLLADEAWLRRHMYGPSHREPGGLPLNLTAEALVHSHEWRHPELQEAGKPASPGCQWPPVADRMRSRRESAEADQLLRTLDQVVARLGALDQVVARLRTLDQVVARLRTLDQVVARLGALGIDVRRLRPDPVRGAARDLLATWREKFIYTDEPDLDAVVVSLAALQEALDD
jgi:hypothetical protein